MARVGECLRAQLSASEVFAEPLAYLSSRPGKQLRPLLLLAAHASAAGSGRCPDSVVECAAAIELIHLSTLCHDDPCDGSHERRGAPTVAAAFDVRTAVALGAYMLGLAIRTLARTAESQAIQLDVELLLKLGQGQLLETFGTLPEAQDLHRHYAEQCYLKTGTLFELSASIGAQLGRISPGRLQDLVTFARHLSVAFQSRDDILDMVHPERVGKLTGTDLQRGLLTLPVIEWVSGLRRPEVGVERLKRCAIDEQTRNRVHLEVRESGAIERAWDFVARESNVAASALCSLPPSPGKAYLLDLVGWLRQD